MAKEGKHYRFRKLEFWAERGLINIIDERFPPEDSKSHNVVTVKQWLQSLQAISSEVKMHAMSIYPDERAEYLRLLEDGVKAARQAKAQGRPDDPKALAEMLRSRRRSYILNSKQSTTGHATAAEGTIENTLLPPIPNHPDIMKEVGTIKES